MEDPKYKGTELREVRDNAKCPHCGNAVNKLTGYKSRVNGMLYDLEGNYVPEAAPAPEPEVAVPLEATPEMATEPDLTPPPPRRRGR